MVYRVFERRLWWLILTSNLGNMKLICLTFFLLFTSPLIAQDVSKDYLVFTKTSGYPRRILMPLNQKIKIRLKKNPKNFKVYLSKINLDNFVLKDSRVVRFDLLDRISGRKYVMQNDKKFGKIIVGLGGALITVATGIIILEVASGAPGVGALIAATSIPLAGGLVSFGIKIKRGRKTFHTKKWNLSVQLGM